MMIRLLFPSIFLMTSVLCAQTNNSYSIQATVFDSLTNEPLSFVKIMVKGTSEDTVSDWNGKFSLTCDKPCVLTLSAAGYETKEIEISTSFLKNERPFFILISPINGGVITKIFEGCSRPVSKDVMLDLIAGHEKMYIIKGTRIKKVDESTHKDIFFQPNEQQLKFILTNNR